MTEFNYDTYRAIKQNLIANVQIIQNLQVGSKLNFDPAVGVFAAATNAERTALNKGRDGINKDSAKNDQRYKYPIVALFYELHRIKLKSLSGNKAKNDHLFSNITETIDNCEAGLRRLLATYQAEQGRFFTKIFNSKENQINNTNDIIRVVENMKAASSYAKLNFIYINSVTFASPNRYNDMWHRANGNELFREYMRRVSGVKNRNQNPETEALPLDPNALIRLAGQWLYNNVYSAQGHTNSIQLSQMKTFYENIYISVKRSARPNFVMLQQRSAGNNLIIRYLPADIYDVDRHQADRNYAGFFFPDTKGKWQPWSDQDKKFKDNTFIEFRFPIKAADSQARLYASIRNNESDICGCLKELCIFLNESDAPGGAPRFSKIVYFKISTPKQQRSDALCIYVDNMTTANAWAPILAEKIGRFANDTVAGFQGQPLKKVGIGVGAEPDTTQYLRPAPEIPTESFSYGTYISRVLAIGMARAAKSNGGNIPALNVCVPYLAQTCAEYGIDYMKPYKPQGQIEGYTKMVSEPTEDLLSNWALRNN